jgi:hypothetical protein
MRHKLLTILIALILIALLPITGHAASATLGSGTKGSGPVLYLNFDESGGPTAYDKSGNNNNGTLNAGSTGSNTAASHMWTPQGKFGGAMEFDGTDDKVRVADTAALDTITNGITIAAWVYRNADQTSWRGLVTREKDTAGANHYHFAFYENQYRFHINTTAGEKTITGTTAPNNQWLHLAATYDGTNVKYYVNGVEQTAMATTHSGTFTADDNPILIGCDTNNHEASYEEYFNGLIDELRIYNRALSADEIKMQFAGGAATHVGGQSASYDPWAGNPPVAWWNLDENTGTSVYDGSGSGLDSTTFDNPTWTHGKYGSALSFDGNDYVGFTYSGTFSAMTITAWIYPTDLSRAWNAIVQTASSGDRALYVKSNGRLQFYSACDSTGDTISTNTWTHVAVTVDGSDNLIYYINGIKSGGCTSTSSPRVIEYFHISGVNAGDGENFIGKIDEVKIYNYVRTPAQIAWDYNQGKPVAHWKFDEALSGAVSTSSGAIKDSSDNGNNGTATNTTWSYTTGKFGGALSFDGNDYVSISDSASLSPTSAVTIEAWVKLNAISDFNIVGKDNSYQLQLESDGDIQAQFWRGSDWSYTAGGDLPTATWVHVAISYDSSATTAKCYQNGAEVASSAVSGSIVDSANPVYIGAWTGSGEWMNGLIDDVRIYNYARTADQIKQDYQSGAAVHLGGTGAVARDGTSSAKAADSALAIKRNFPNSTDGVYWIDPDGEGGSAAFQVYCDMTYDGGGWTLALKSLNDNSDFYYTATYWTTNNTLNPTDFGIDNAINSKYNSFNTLKFKEILITDADRSSKRIFTLASSLQNQYTLLDLTSASYDTNTDETIESGYLGSYYNTSYLFDNITLDGHEHYLCHKLAFSGDHYSSNIDDHGVARIGYSMSQEYPCGHPGTAEGFGLRQVASGTHNKGSGRVQWSTETDYFSGGLIYIR